MCDGALEDCAMKHSQLTGEIIRAAIEVHSTLGPGLLENAYRLCLRHELTLNGLNVEMEYAVPIVYKGTRIDVGYRTDLLVEKLIVVECKAVPALLPVHRAQTLSQIRLGNYPVGLLINFHVEMLKDGIQRFVN